MSGNSSLKSPDCRCAEIEVSDRAFNFLRGVGLRASEVVGLKVSDVDSQRMVLRIQQGKGRKDRYDVGQQLLNSGSMGEFRGVASS